MHYVYILRTIRGQERRYVGLTDDLRRRLADHNRGKVTHTAKYGPWHIETYFAFSDRTKASAFERYLKSGSGRAFAKRHF